MRFTDEISLVSNGVEYDAALNAVQKTVERRIGRCLLTTNKTHSVTRSEDGISYKPSYTVIIANAEKDVELQRGDCVHIVSHSHCLNTVLSVADIQKQKRYTLLWL
jgi:hypothetical protein